jgi:branched-chain amino acid transport system permease protein
MTSTAALVQTRDAVIDAVRDARLAWSRRSTAAILVVVGAVLVPVLPVDVGLDRLAADLYLGAAAVGLGIVVGLGGMPSLGHGAFVALGAFGAALLGARAGWPTEAAVAGGVLVATAAGVAVGFVAGRVRPVLVAVVTWLLAWLVAIGLAAFPSFSGGAQGIALDRGSLAGVRLSATAHYEIAVALVALAVLAYVLLARAPAGIALSAARERRTSAERLGVPVARMRAGVFAAGAGIAGLAGALAVYLAGVADGQAYEPLLSAKLFIAVVLGGALSPAGGLVGVAVLAVLGRLTEIGGLESSQATRVETLLVAVIVLSALGATDRGLLPSLADWRRRRRDPGLPASSHRLPAHASSLRAPVGSTSLQGRGLTKQFGVITALEGVDIDLAGGRIEALIGPNGSGKSTALHLLTGALRPDAGSIVAGSEDVSRTDLTGRAELGIVGTPQATAVFSELTALENALVGARLRLPHGGVARGVFATPKSRADLRAGRKAALDALERVGLGGVGEVPAGELPGAAQRRLMIASALATQPGILLLDEPAAGAGQGEVELLAELIGELRSSGLAILLIDHNLRLVRRIADRVTVLVAGRVIARGTAEEVLEDDAVLQAYLGGRPI